jgi:hypothetical protein
METEQSAEPFATNDATGAGHVLLISDSYFCRKK